MSRPPTFGSPRWVDLVFESGPSRDPRGRSRATQRYVTLHPGCRAPLGRGEPLVAEGGSESISRSLLTTMILAGFVKRFKLQPFRMHPAEFGGLDAYPDILFECADSRLYVVEAKSMRFLTNARLEKCRSVERHVNASEMRYLLWTDAWPLSPMVWQLLRNVRRLGTSEVDPRSIEELVNEIAKGSKTVAELRSLGHYTDALRCATWRGLVHFNLFKEFNDDTLVSCNVGDRHFGSLLSARVDAQSWWDTVPRSPT